MLDFATGRLTDVLHLQPCKQSLKNCGVGAVRRRVQRRTGGIEPDYTRRIRTESALSRGASRDRRSRDDVAIRVTISTATRARSGGKRRSCSGHEVEGITALGSRSEHGVKQLRIRAADGTGTGRTDCGKARWEAVTVG